MEKLEQALSDDSRNVYILDKNYKKIGPIASYSNDIFYLKWSHESILADSIAGLTEPPRTYAVYGGLIGAVTGILAAVSIAINNPPPNSNVGGDLAYHKAFAYSLPIFLAGLGGVLGGIVGGKIHQESINFPIYQIH